MNLFLRKYTLQFYLPAWVSALPADHPLKTALYAALRERTANVSKLREAEPALETLRRQREALYRICADYAIREDTAQAAAEVIAAIWREQV